MRGPNDGVVEYLRQVFSRYGGTLDFAAALYAAFDQVAYGKPHVGLERVDARVVQSIAQPWHVGRCFGSDENNRCAIESALGGRARRKRTQIPCPLGIRSPNVEMRTLTIIPHHKRTAVGETSVNVNDRRSSAAGLRVDAIAGLKNESASDSHRIVSLLTPRVRTRRYCSRRSGRNRALDGTRQPARRSCRG